MLTPSDVTAAYKVILGRSPENAAVIAHQVWAVPTLAELRNTLMSSEEFLQKIKHDDDLRDALMPIARALDVIGEAQKRFALPKPLPAMTVLFRQYRDKTLKAPKIRDRKAKA